MTCENTMDCTCTYRGCSRHGKCCECIAYHNRMNEVPGCLFSKAGERTYDRSIEALYRDYMKNK
ncbi:MAG: hypothetical protein HN948_08470 [Clostridia bacterium]|jgi:hypothetical protein|nr:hypothetical protein [Clostridia bacterium]MBT7123026.1 hypothetical protein [Clostridia bacterium]